MKIRLGYMRRVVAKWTRSAQLACFLAEVRIMDNMRRVLVFKLVEGDFETWKNLIPDVDKLLIEMGSKIYKREINESDQTSLIDINFISEEAMIQQGIAITRFFCKYGIKTELISRKRILPEEIERDLKEFKEAVAAL